MKKIAFLLLLLPTTLMASAATTECRTHYDNAEYEKALPACRQLAESGDSNAQTILGELYDRGLAVDADPAKAAHWWQRAAEVGDLEAQNFLAMKYYYGGDVFGPQEGWAQNYAEAMRLWRLTAEKGNGASQFMLAGMYRMGQGVPKDLVEAYAWYMLSEKTGYKLATEDLYVLNRQMAPTEKMAGTIRFEEYAARYSK